MHHPGAFAAQFAKDGGQAIGQLRGENTEQLMPGPGGVGQWAEHIEDRGDAKRSAGGADEFHGGMMVAGEGEADIGLVQATRDSCGWRDSSFTPSFSSTSAEPDLLDALAIAVLDDFHAGGRDDDGGGGGDVECSAHVAAGAAGVDDDTVPDRNRWGWLFRA